MLVVRKLSSLQVVLVAIVVGFFIDHEGAALHPDGVAAVEGAHQVRTVIATLIMTPREVLVFIKGNLDREIIMVLFLFFIDHAVEYFNTTNYIIMYIYCFSSLFLALSCC